MSTNSISRNPSPPQTQTTGNAGSLSTNHTQTPQVSRTSQGTPALFGNHSYETSQANLSGPTTGTPGIQRTLGTTTVAQLSAGQTPRPIERSGAVTAATTAPVNAGDPTGILTNMSPSGASTATARQDKIKQGGVEASQQLAQNDYDRVMKHKSTFETVGKKYDIPPAVLAGIASRETRGGALLDKQGYGQYDPNGYGLLQVDKNHHTLQGTNHPASLGHIEQAAGIFSDNYKEIKEKHPDWTPEQQLQAAVASYNKGGASFRKMTTPPTNFDRGTTGGDYSNDVIARAQHFAKSW